VELEVEGCTTAGMLVTAPDPHCKPESGTLEAILLFLQWNVTEDLLDTEWIGRKSCGLHKINRRLLLTMFNITITGFSLRYVLMLGTYYYII